MPCIHRDAPVLYVRHVPLVLLHNLWLESAVPVAGDAEGYVPERRGHILAAVPVAAVEFAFPTMHVLLIAEMVVELALEHLLQHRREHVLEHAFDILYALVSNSSMSSFLSVVSCFASFFAIIKSSMFSLFLA